MLGSHLRLVEYAADPELVRVLSQLLQEAKDGRVNGFAYVAIEPGYKFTADVLGSAKKSPFLALGMIKALEGAVLKFFR